MPALESIVPAAESAAPLRAVTPVGIAVEQLTDLRRALRERSVDAFDAANLLDDTLALLAPMDDYLAACSSPPSPALAALDARTQREDWARRFADADTRIALEAEMLSGHVEGQLLRMLVALTGARDVLEIGLFTGYSALAMAEALPAGGRIVGCELDPYAADIARQHFAQAGLGGCLDLRVGPAQDTLSTLVEQGEAFDLVFIDADKTGYTRYLRALLDGRLVRPGGLIVADNTLYQSQVYRAPAERTDLGQGVAEFNAFVADHPRLDSVVLPLRDGVSLIRVRDDTAGA